MDDLPTTGDLEQEKTNALTRREFMLLAAFAGSGALLLLSRCRPPFAPAPDQLPPLEIPPDFRRFMLIAPLTGVAGEKRIMALGSQCPDLACALWWADSQEFAFFDSSAEIEARYAGQEGWELVWLD